MWCDLRSHGVSGSYQAAAFDAIEEKLCRNTHVVMNEVAKGILPCEAAENLALQRVKKAMGYRRWSLFSSDPGFV